MKNLKITAKKSSPAIPAGKSLKQLANDQKKQREEKQRLIEEKQRQEAEKISKYKLSLAQKIRSSGFASLDKSEVLSSTKIVDNLIIKLSEALDEDYKIYEAMLADELGYRHLNLRVQVTSAQRLKAMSEVNTKMLKNIDQRLGSIDKHSAQNKMVNSPAAILAARELGEQPF